MNAEQERLVEWLCDEEEAWRLLPGRRPGDAIRNEIANRCADSARMIEDLAGQVERLENRIKQLDINAGMRRDAIKYAKKHIPEWREECVKILKEKGRVPAVKYCRNVTGRSLRDSLDFVKSLEQLK